MASLTQAHPVKSANCWLPTALLLVAPLIIVIIFSFGRRAPEGDYDLS